MDYEVRRMMRDEWPLLEDFLYEAIYVPEGFEGEVPRSVIHDDPKCRAAFEGFGALPDDRAVVAVVDDEIVGACWARTTDEYGHIDDETPSLSISLYGPYRGKGLGAAMMRQMLDELRGAGYARASLSVQKENPALRLYERMGFRVVGDGFDETEWLMVRRFESNSGRATGMKRVPANA
ncbi:MAG: GNAT family N-acetyltransferase [Atopobiaceae bacterium]|nr:GNAT family N-acetyltransferase [Atopobiaceae bacterium]